jgi:chromosome partitioning protein
MQGKGRGVVAVRSLAVLNLKGGSAKTTTALSMAAVLASRNTRVLVIDADSQGNAGMTLLDGEPAHAPTLGNVLLGQAGASEAIRSTRFPSVDVLPSDARLADAALLLADQLGRERRLRLALAEVADDYDVCIVDCPPQLSLVSVNVLNAVGEILTPIDAGIYSVAGLARLQDVAEEVRRFLDNPTLRITGLVLTRTHANRATRDIEAQLREAFGPTLLKTTIPHSVRVEEAHARHRTVVEFAPKSPPALAYAALVSEVFGDGKQRTRRHAARHTDPVERPDAA